LKHELLNNVKAQITIFIIIGIIILFVSASVIYIRMRVSEKPIDIEEEVVLEVPLQTGPLNDYVTKCIEQSAVEALTKLGEKGGYIDLSEWDLEASADDPTEHDAVSFTRGSAMQVPYWWYLVSDNDCHANCVFKQGFPLLKSPTPLGEERLADDSSIEAQIDRFVNSNLRECLGDFEQFKEQGYTIEEQDDISTTTVVTEDDVSVFVDYIIKATLGTDETELSRFHAKIPLNLKRVYEMAEEIADKEMDNNIRFLERVIKEVIATYSIGNDPPLPPMAGGMNLEGRPRERWSKRESKTLVEEKLVETIQFLRIYGTRNFDMINSLDPYTRGIYANTILEFDPSAFSLSDLGAMSAHFVYLGWPTYFDINPSSGDLIRPSGMHIGSPIDFGFSDSAFYYDVSFPVVIQINDHEAFNGQGYLFQFALEANLRSNDAIDADYSPIMVGAAEETLLCNPDQADSGDVTIETLNAAVSGEPIDEVNVFFSCGLESCAVGMTGEEEPGIIKTRFPSCIGGLLTFEKEDFLKTTIPFNIGSGMEKEITVEMQPYREKKIIVKKKVLRKNMNGEWALEPSDIEDLSYKESAIVSIERVKDPGDPDFASVVEYWGEQQYDSAMDFVPGMYSITASSILQLCAEDCSRENVVIPEREVCVDYGPFGLWCDETETIQEIAFDDIFPSGSLKIDGIPSYWELNENDLDDAETIVFYIAAPDIDDITIHEDVDMVSVGESEEGLGLEIKPHLMPDLID